jgi:hypothetical protein
MERGEEAANLKANLFKHPHDVLNNEYIPMKVDEEDVVTVCLFATANPHLYKRY